MTEGQISTLFATPELGRPQRGDERARRSGIREWVQSLPLANVGQTAHMLYDRLAYLNAHQIPQADRYAILEALRPALDLVLQSLDRHYLSEDLPLAGRAALVARLSRELQGMMVLGYQLVLLELKDTSPLARAIHNGRRGEVLHRKLYYLGRLLLEDFQLYRKHPEGLWRDIHGGYLEALRLDLQDRPYDREDPQFPGRSSISDLYKQQLLLGLSGPYRLLQGEVQRVYNALYGWAPLSRLLPLAHAESGAALYLVEPDSDGPPHYREEVEPAGMLGWMLDTSQLAEVLGRELETLGGSAPRAGAARPQDWLVPLSAELVGRLTLAWGLGGSRSAARQVSDGELNLIYGIDSIISVLGAAHLLSPFAEAPELSPSHDGDGSPPSQLQGGQAADARVDGLAVDEDIALFAEGETPAPWSRTLQEGRVAIDAGRVIDRSLRGFHVRLSRRRDRPRRVGDLVGVAEPSPRADGRRWRVGVIRWMRSNAADDIRLGVEILSDRAEPVALWWQRPDRGEEVAMPSLLLAEPEQAAEGLDLVTPAFFPASSDRLAVDLGGRRQTVRVLQSLERTRSFVHCRYAPAAARRSPTAAPAPSEAPIKQPAQPEDEFDTLWRNL